MYEYIVEMCSGAMRHVSSFIKTGSAIQKFIRGIHRHEDAQTHREHGDCIRLLLFF
jgi:hypothetical protein